MTLFTFAAVILRFGFNRGLPDAFDFARLSQGVALAWGIALATYDREHIGIDIKWSALGERVGLVVNRLADVISAAFLATLAWVMMARALKSVSTGGSTAELRVPLWPVNLVIATGIVVAFAASLALFLKKDDLIK
ncbi:TRAP transporter small permease [Mesobacterium pallidum]|uniref:TRAP transporter small permease n=1 Tax=Mesobacterium pallidum TaxID=2872037 RepID=UPI001EE289B0